jgi:hypothetical protein
MPHNELERYSEYVQKIKYRLIPGIWLIHQIFESPCLRHSEDYAARDTSIRLQNIIDCFKNTYWEKL